MSERGADCEKRRCIFEEIVLCLDARIIVNVDEISGTGHVRVMISSQL